jgi:hypothetical protein
MSLARKAITFFRRLYQGQELPSDKPFVGLRLKNHAQCEMICDCCTDEGCGGDDCSACVVRQEYE